MNTETKTTGYTYGIEALGTAQAMVIRDGERVIAHVYNRGDIDETERIAKLIAAAPDLLEALQRLQPILWNDGPLVEAYRDIEKLVEAAIARATQ